MKKLLFTLPLLGLAYLVSGQASVKFKLEQPNELQVDAGTDVSFKEYEEIKIGTDIVVTGGTADYWYTWTPDKCIEDRHTKFPTVYPESTTFYRIWVNDKNNCTALDSVKVTVIKNNSFISSTEQPNIFIYPNPVVDHFKIAGGSLNGLVNVSIVSLSGKTIYSKTVDASILESKVFSSPEEEGVYMLKVESEGISKSFQIIISNK